MFAYPIPGSPLSRMSLVLIAVDQTPAIFWSRRQESRRRLAEQWQLLHPVQGTCRLHINYFKCNGILYVPVLSYMILFRLKLNEEVFCVNVARVIKRSITRPKHASHYERLTSLLSTVYTYRNSSILRKFNYKTEAPTLSSE